MKVLHIAALFSLFFFQTPLLSASAATPPPPEIIKPFGCAELFKELEVIQLELRSDFEKVRADREKNAQDGEDSGFEKAFTEAILSEVGVTPKREVKAKIRSRGNSSNWEGEAEFPKLKIKFEEGQDLTGTPFQNTKGFRINTHISTHPKTKYTEMGRINGEAAPWRESLAYGLAKTLELKTPGNRQARILYRDVKTNEVFTRNALLVENDKSTAKRLGAEIVDYDTFSSDATSGIDPIEGAKFHLFHKMIGNADVSLRVNQESVVSTEIYRPMWNTLVLSSGGKRFPVVYDLDMSAIVTKAAKGDAHPGFGIPSGEGSQFITSASALFAHFTKDQLREAVDFFKTKKEALLLAIKNHKIDEAGRRLAKNRVNAFFATVDEWLKLPVIADDTLPFFSDAKGTVNRLGVNPMTEEPATLRLGTPVKILGTEGEFLKVEVLNPFFDLADDGLIGYIRKDAKIAESLTIEQVQKVDLREIAVVGN